MAEIVLKNLSKVYDNGFAAVDDFNLEIRPHEFIIFVGPSGCGKSTTLRMIAGLEEISSGELWIDDMLANFMEPKERELAMVFQNYALYPNMTVYKNIAFSLEIRGVKKKEVDRRVRETASLLGLEQVLDRRPKDLSGGQRQRVAIGNAIIRNPQVLLMDEPLSNLDAKLRDQMRVELLKLHEHLGNTIIYVTHDQTEAMTLGTRIVVMNHGKIQQVDTPMRIYANPVNKFVAGFIGSPSMNFLSCKLEEYENSNTKVIVLDNGKCISCTKQMSAWLANMETGKEYTLGIRPEHFRDSDDGMGEQRQMMVKVHHRELLGKEVLLYFNLCGKECCMRTLNSNTAKIGDEIAVYIDMENACLFDNETDNNLLYEYR